MRTSCEIDRWFRAESKAAMGYTAQRATEEAALRLVIRL
jgi:hypothetical protein